MFARNYNAHAGSILTPQEKEENSRLVVNLEYNEKLGVQYLRHSTAAQFKKEDWQARKDKTNNCLWKSFCKTRENYHRKIEEKNEAKGRMYMHKSDKFEDILKHRKINHDQHIRLLEKVEESKPKANGRLRRTKSFEQPQRSQQVQQSPPKADGRHSRTQSH